MEDFDNIRVAPEEIDVNVIEAGEDKETGAYGAFTKKVVDVVRSLSKTRRSSQNRGNRSEEEGSINENAGRGRRRYRTYGEKEKRGLDENELLEREYERAERYKEKLKRIERNIAILKMENESDSSSELSEMEELEEKREPTLRRVGTIQRLHKEEKRKIQVLKNDENEDECTDSECTEYREREVGKSPLAGAEEGHEKPKTSASFFVALKNNTLLYKDTPTRDNLAGWLTGFWDMLELCWPNQLTEKDKIKLCTTRFPSAIQKAANNAELDTKKQLFTLASTLFGHGGLNQAKSYRRFFEATPQNQSGLLAYVNHLEQLSQCIDLPESKRTELILEQVVANIPIAYRHMLRQREDIAKVKGRKITVISMLKPIFDDTQAVLEIERFFKADKSKTYQVKESKEEQRTEQKREVRSVPPMRNERNMTQGFRPSNERHYRDSRMRQGPRCVRCGLVGHTGSQCKTYRRESNAACNWCDKNTRVKNFHFESDCQNKTRRN